MLRLPVDSRSVTRGRRAAAQYAEEMGARPETLWRVRVAVSEALANAVLHAHTDPGDAYDQHLLLLATCNRLAMRLSVCDHGVGLRAHTPSPGMGLAVIEKSCDALEFEATPGGGTTVTMTFAC